MLAATLRFSARFNSWWISETPSASASSTDRIGAGRPSTRISPESGGWMPARIFISVLLPAPFSPMTATTSPRPRVSPTPRSAFTPGKLFTRARASSSGASPAAATAEAGAAPG